MKTDALLLKDNGLIFKFNQFVEKCAFFYQVAIFSRGLHSKQTLQLNEHWFLWFIDNLEIVGIWLTPKPICLLVQISIK